jgi:hypothetical protein
MEELPKKPDKVLHGITESAWLISVSPNHIRNLIKLKALDTVRVGRRVMITRASIVRLIEGGGIEKVN